MRSSRTMAALAATAALTLAVCTSPEPSPETRAAASQNETESRNGDIPSFSDPTRLTNTYLPLAQGGRWIYEGTKDGEPYLIEVAVTDRTKTLHWNGNATEASVLRHRGWVNGVLIEEAYDFYAQGDDGGVWYFGETVDNFKNGKLADHDGSWIAGVDGALPALLMPGDPRAGQVFYSEDVVDLNIVERDKILSLNQPTETPSGPVENGLLLGATQPDGTKEKKIFVPEVGEVLARSAEGEVRLVERLPQNTESASAMSFSKPTKVDNPYFGVSGLDYRLYLGEDEGQPLRIEVALTDRTKGIDWNGGTTETAVSQFTATSRRKLLEIAVDWFAQDDAGNVWYFGENVWNYDRGRVANRDGSWTAGINGPPGMIMPGDPSLGQRFNPENIPASVFETVDVKSLSGKYQMPTGPWIDDAVVLHETLADGTEETKMYARGYGNISVHIPGIERVDIVYALPNDSIDSPLPDQIREMVDELRAISADGTGDAGRLSGGLDAYVGRRDPVPPVLLHLAGKQMNAVKRAWQRDLLLRREWLRWISSRLHSIWPASTERTARWTRRFLTSTHAACSQRSTPMIYRRPPLPPHLHGALRPAVARTCQPRPSMRRRRPMPPPMTQTSRRSSRQPRRSTPH